MASVTGPVSFQGVRERFPVVLVRVEEYESNLGARENLL